MTVMTDLDISTSKGIYDRQPPKSVFSSSLPTITSEEGNKQQQMGLQIGLLGPSLLQVLKTFINRTESFKEDQTKIEVI